VNNIKNFLNQTLLHFASENNDIELCTYLLKYGADCLLEDNYRQTPFIIAAKLDSLELLDLFTNEIKKHPKQSHNLNKQIRAASYHACNFGNLRIIKYLFDQFGLHSEDLINEFNRTNQVNYQMFYSCWLFILKDECVCFKKGFSM
jgi:ankyrin repeat protein